MVDFKIILSARPDGSASVESQSDRVGESPLGRIAAGRLTSLADSASGLADRHGIPHSAGVRIGLELSDLVLGSGIAELLQRAIEDVERSQEVLRLLICYRHHTDGPIAHRVPWELLTSPVHGEFLALHPRIVLARYCKQPGMVQEMSASPFRVLVTVGSDDTPESDAGDGAGGVQLRNPGSAFAEEELNRILSCLRAPGPQHVIVKPLQFASARELRQQLVRAKNAGTPFHCWHHIGHGDLLDNRFGLRMPNDAGEEHTDFEDISAALEKAGLLVAVLNVCHGAHEVALAPSLAELNVPLVVGYSGEVLAQRAARFAHEMYTAAMVQCRALDEAACMARRGLSGGLHIAWAKVVVYLRTRRPLLVSV